MKWPFPPLFVARLLLIQLGLWLGGGVAWAVTLSVTPAAISDQVTGMITLAITDLINGETVDIDKFLDTNSNGVIDGGDLMTQRFQLTDGQVSLIGGRTNINVPGDSNPAVGNITTLLNFQSIGVEHIVGSYLFRLSSPTARFTPVTNTFSITNSAYLQSFTGQVRSNGTATAVANAIVVLLGTNTDGNNFVGGTVANNSGNYTFKAAPGTYQLAAFKSTFVGDFTASAVNLGAGVTVPANVNLVPATRTISGRVADASNPNTPLPGIMLFLESSDGLVALSFTDTNGGFNAPVTAGNWRVRPQGQDTALHGYVGLQNSIKINTISGSVAGVNILLPKGTALFYGSVRDDLGNLLPGIDVSGSDRDTYESDGVSDANGNYAVVARAGNWHTELTNDDPRLANYVFPGSSGATTLANGQAVRQDFVLRRAANHITGRVKDNFNNPIAGVDVFANANINGSNFRTFDATTDGNGNFTLNVANGTWQVGVSCGCDDCDNSLGAKGYQCVNNQQVTISGNDGVVNFTAQSCDALQVTTTSLPDGIVGTFYNARVQAFGCQQPFQWSLSPGSAPLPSGITLNGDNLSGTPKTAGTYNFFVRVTDDNFDTADQPLTLTISGGTLEVTTTSLPSGTLNTFYSQSVNTSGGQQPYIWSLTPGSLPLPSGLDLSSDGTISGTPGLNGTFHFFVRVTDGALNTSEQQLSIEILVQPDLRVTNIVAPAEAWSDNLFDVRWDVANIGTDLASGPWVDRVFLSSDNQPGNDLLLGEFPYSQGLVVGQRVSRTQIVTIPRSQSTNGTYYIMVVTDAANNVSEGPGEGNNASVRTQPIAVRLTPLPDLIVESLQAPATAYSGQTITIFWNVSNRGTGSTDAPDWYDQVYLSVDRVPDATDAWRSEVFNASYLSLNESYGSSMDLEVPIGFSGTYYVIVKTDSRNHVAEGNETNNANYTAIQIQLSPPPDLRIISVSAPENGFSGYPIQIYWTVKNTGTGPIPPSQATWSDAVYLSTTTNFNVGNARRIGTFPHTGPLATNLSYTVSNLSVELPRDVSGSYFVYVVTDDGNQVFEHSGENNNFNYDPIPLQVTLVSQSIQVRSAGTSYSSSENTLRLTYTVSNQGVAPTLLEQWPAYLSSSSDLDTNAATFLAYIFYSGGLDPGLISTQTVVLPFPPCISGQFYLFVINGAQTNQLGQVLFDFVPPDLQVASVSAPTNAVAGQFLPVRWSVTNAGSGPTPQSSWTDSIYLSPTTTFNSTNAINLGGFPHVGSLSAGNTYVQNQQVGLPVTVPAGSYYVFVESDSTNNVAECANETNNVGRTVATVQIISSRPDLRVSSLSAPVSAESGKSISLSWTVANSGAGIARGFRQCLFILPPCFLPIPVDSPGYGWSDGVYLSIDQTLNSMDILLGQTTHTGSVAGGDDYQAALNAQLPHGLAGSYYLLICADSITNVFEFDETNNCSAFPIQIITPPLPDLQVTDIAVPTSAYSGQTLTLSYTITNNGPAATDINDWTDLIYLSRDQVIDPTDATISFVQHRGVVASQGGYTNNVEVGLPNGVSGPYYIFVCADQHNSLFESDEVNNCAYAPTAVQIIIPPPADLVVTSVTSPATGAPGQPGVIGWTVLNQGTNTATGGWSDSVYLSADTVWDINDAFVARILHSGAIAPGASYPASVTNVLPGVLPGVYHVVVRTDIRNNVREGNENNNAGVSASTVSLDATELTLAVPYTSSLSSGTEHYYKVNAPIGEDLLITLDSMSTNSANELYVRIGAMPNPGNYDYLYGRPFESDQDIFIPNTRAGLYYILVRGDNVPNAPQNYQLQARTLPFGPAQVFPTSGGNNGNVTVRIHGGRFGPLLQARLFAGTNSISAKDVYFVNSALAHATFDLHAAPVGPLSLELSQPHYVYDEPANAFTQQWSKAILTNSFEVQLGMASRLSTYMVKPSAVRIRQSFPINVFFKNEGNTDLLMPLLTITARGGLIHLAGVSDAPNDSLQVLALSSEDPTWVLPPGGIGSIALDALPVAGSEGVELSMNTTHADNSPVDYNSLRQSLAEAVDESVWQAFRSKAGPSWESLLAVLGGSPILAVANQPLELKIVVLDYLEGVQIVESIAKSWRNAGDARPLGNGPAPAGSLYCDVLYASMSALVGESSFIPFIPNARLFLLKSLLCEPGDLMYPADSSLAGQIKRHPDYRGVKSKIEDLVEQACARSSGLGPGTHPIPLSLGGEITLCDCNSRSLDYFLAIGTGHIYLPSQVTLNVTITEQILPCKYGGHYLMRRGVVSGKLKMQLIDTYHYSPIGAGDTIIDLPPNPFNILPKLVNSMAVLMDTCHKACAFHTTVDLSESISGSWAIVNDHCLCPPALTGVVDESIVKVVCPLDPNEMVGPAGFGAAGFVGVQQTLPYTIYFENVASASAPAQTIRITAPIHPSQDARTFRLGEIMFGTNKITVPENRSYYQTRINLGSDYGNILADVFAGMDIQAGLAFWVLTAIDPATGEFPSNPLLGLLSPNNTNHIGEGHVTFTIMPKAGTPSGVAITNMASIVFDTNEPIDTNPVKNTIDGAPPTSSVTALAAFSADPILSISWSGADDTNGSGLQGFDIYVSDNNGAWTLWQTGVGYTKAPFAGERRHAYRFYSIARDNAGNAEPAPPGPDAVTVVLSDTNLPPVLAPISDQTILVGNTLTISSIATDSDIPVQQLTFSLDAGAPSGASVNQTTGVLTWTPMAVQAPRTNVITVIVRDNGTPVLSASNTFNVIVNEVRNPLIIDPVSDRFIAVGQSLVITNQAHSANIPITFNLGAGAPTGSFLTTNGVFSWAPSCLQGSTTNLITVWAADSGSSPSSNSMTFVVTVSECLQVGIGSTVVQVGHSGRVSVDLFSTVGLTNLSFTLAYPPNRFSNWTVAASNNAIGATLVQNIDATQTAFTFRTKAGQTLQGPSLAGSIEFSALPGPSAFLPLVITSITGTKSDNTAVGNVFGQSAQIVVIGREPVLEAWLGTDFSRRLTLYGNPGASYAIDYRTDLLRVDWQPGVSVSLTNLFETFITDEKPPQIFYRAWELSAEPSILKPGTAARTNLLLLLYGEAGTNNSVEARTNRSSGSVSIPDTNVIMTDSFQSIIEGTAINRIRFFRAKH